MMTLHRRQATGPPAPAAGLPLWLPGRGSAPPALVTEVLAFDSQMFDTAGLAGLIARAATFWRAREQTPVRVLAVSEPFSAEPALQRLQELWRATPPDQ